MDDNTDLFYNEIREGVSQILIGTCGSHTTPLVLLGGNGKIISHSKCDESIVLTVFFSDCVRAFTQNGTETFWMVVNGHVNSMALIDVNKDGKNEVFNKYENVIL